MDNDPAIEADMVVAARVIELLHDLDRDEQFRVLVWVGLRMGFSFRTEEFLPQPEQKRS